MKKHGEMIFYWTDDLLTIELKGPFNEEGMEYAINEIKKTVFTKGLKRWRRLEILCEETMGSPIVLDAVKDSYEWYEENGCYSTAIVVRNNLQIYVIEKIFQNNTVNIFKDVLDAKGWIDEQ